MKANTNWVRITPIENIPQREGRSVQIGDVNVAIFNVGQRFLAIENRCPHSGGPLCEGILSGSSVVCPLHAWKIDLESGNVLRPKDILASVQTFPVKVQDGIVLLGLQDGEETYTPPAPAEISAFERPSTEAAW